MQKHVLTHTGEQPYPCPDINCTERFTKKSAADSHFFKAHMYSAQNNCSNLPADDSRSSQEQQTGQNEEPSAHWDATTELQQYRFGGDWQQSNQQFSTYPQGDASLISLNQDHESSSAVHCDSSPLSAAPFNSYYGSEDNEKHNKKPCSTRKRRRDPADVLPYSTEGAMTPALAKKYVYLS